jgi:hypothetical protein
MTCSISDLSRSGESERAGGLAAQRPSDCRAERLLLVPLAQRLLVLRIVRCPPARAQRRGLANNGSGGRRTILKGGNRGAELSRVRNDAGLWGFEGGACRAQ